MTTSRSNTPGSAASESDMPAALRMQLRAMRADIAPPAHLWESIDARLDRVPMRSPAQRSRRPVLALAAALAVAAVGGSWVWSTRTAPEPLLAQGAGAVASDPTLQDTFATLDHEMREIQRALRQDPTSRVLLQQLHRVDSIRLTLSLRATHG